MRFIRLNAVMAGVILACCFISSVFASDSVSASMVSPSAALLKRLKAASTYQAHFEQSTVDAKGQAVGQASVGEMMFKQPGRMRWETTQPNAQLLVSDGKTLWVYDKELEQVTKRPAVVEGQFDPVSLLTGGQTDLDKLFNVTMSDQSAHHESNFTLTPKKNRDEDSALSSWEEIQIQFGSNASAASKGVFLTALVMKNSFGQTTTFRFTHVKVDQVISDTLFSFKPPAGVDVYSQ